MLNKTDQLIDSIIAKTWEAISKCLHQRPAKVKMKYWSVQYAFLLTNLKIFLQIWVISRNCKERKKMYHNRCDSQYCHSNLSKRKEYYIFRNHWENLRTEGWGWKSRELWGQKEPWTLASSLTNFMTLGKFIKPLWVLISIIKWKQKTFLQRLLQALN